jgi:DNA-directed RNA polymerase specialized sigma24 family protein
VDIEPELVAEPFSVDRLWEVWEVRRAVDALPAAEADVVRLAHYYQFTQSEIAARLGVPLGTVKSRSLRAHRRLAASLQHLLDGEPGPAGGPAPPGSDAPRHDGPDETAPGDAVTERAGGER